MKNYIYFVIFILTSSAYSACNSQEDSLISEVARDKDFYEYNRLIYKELGYYTPGKSINNEIINMIKQYPILNVKDVCKINLEYFDKIPNAIEYLKNSCEINKVNKKLNSKYGFQFLQDNFDKITQEFDKLYKNHPDMQRQVKQIRK